MKGTEIIKLSELTGETKNQQLIDYQNKYFFIENNFFIDERILGNKIDQ